MNRSHPRDEAMTMLTAVLQPRDTQGKIAPAPPTRPALVRLAVAREVALGAVPAQPATPSMTVPPSALKPREFFIHGITKDGRPFRPSDWAERLASAMSCFRPDNGAAGAGGIGAFIGYSPYCVPKVVDGVKCVIVNQALRGIEPMAWDFVMHFARDNDLQLSEVGDPPDKT
jgi:hypothetical protein